MYCCPTPPVSPSECSAGPVEKTKYVEAVHKLCPSVYAYAYDDGVGLAQCPAGTTAAVTTMSPSSARDDGGHLPREDERTRWIEREGGGIERWWKSAD